MIRAIVAVAVLLVAGGPALADHATGELVHAERTGPYRLEVRAGRTEGSGSHFLEYSVSVTDAETDERVQDAAVTATAQTPDGALGPLELGGLGEAWTIAIPIAEGQEIDWRMEVTVESSLGMATMTHPLELAPPAPTASPPAPGETSSVMAPILRIGAPVVGLLLLGLLLRRRGRGRPGDGPPEGYGDDASA